MSDAVVTNDVSFVAREQVAASLRRLMKTHAEFYWAVAWGSENPALSELLHHIPKIKTLVIGTSFYQTPPDFLEQFKTVKSARVNAPDGATFHPKAYLFISGKSAAALIGSANFTKSAMEFNAEACCLVQGDAGSDFFRKLKAFVTVDCWDNALLIDEDFLRAYRIQHEATKTARASLRKFVHLKRSKHTARTTDPLEMDWPGFASRVRHDKYCQRRLDVLSAMKDLFARKNSFADLEENERKAIAATLGKNQKTPSGLNPDLDWGMFGNMRAFGIFRTLIIERPQDLSDALDCIPPTGPINERDYDRFTAHFQRAFAGKSRTGGAPSASRLLAMKRPDYFVCFDTRNQKGICEHFGLTVNSIDLDAYWTMLIERIQLSAWWNAPRPIGRDRAIWDGRAALLDALFYSHM